MQLFELYFRLGIGHITDLKAWDHMLFLVAMCAVYPLKEWRRLLILVTAFTIGHSLTLILATLGGSLLPNALVEFLIPLTIFLTALLNLNGRPGRRSKSSRSGIRMPLKYFLALVFGLVHGMGFSSYLRELLGEGSSLLLPLLAFNLGVEAGQILVVGAFLLLSSLVLTLIRQGRRAWTLSLTGLSIVLSLMMMIKRFPW